MNFALDDEQTMLRDSARRFVAQDYSFASRRALVDEGGGFSAAHWDTFAAMGWLGAGLPEACGGFGGGAVETALVAQELGRGLVVEPYVDVAVLSAQLLRLAGGGPLLGALVDGGARVVTALGEGQGALAPGAVATLLAGGPQATHFLLPVRAEAGPALYVLEAQAAARVRRDYRLVDGSTASDLVLDRDALAAATPLPCADVEAALAEAVAHGRAATCAEALGAMELALWTTRDYMHQRRQFGTPLAGFQALQHRLADMLVAQEQARAALHGALAALAQGDARRRDRAVAMAKVQSGRSGRFVGAQAIQLHGGIGMTDEYVVGHCFKRLMVLDRRFGSAQELLAVLGAGQEAIA
jgi:hypothetical protein